ncbi:LysR family transcriptional regulator substrate-binding protein [Streptomyces monomycini]|uniref:LysR family transcriptional regulator substrate-binding protein n=1 Tax=Streptomyces monomycini TaxID=371720 RepID=UPI0004AB8DAA|nr:LysR family transcriptional regulator substrate-binding protein [Streptomyces monomycini]
MTGSEETLSFRLAYVPGVTPAKWVRIWNERLPGIPLELVAASADAAYDVLRDGGADAGFVRLPADRTFFSAIPLYTETTVVVVPKDHLFTAADEVSTEDLADEIVLHPLDDTLDWERPPGRPAFERPATTADAIELVAAGIGLLVVPQSLARLHHRKDLKYRTLTDAPQSQVALAWPEERTTDQVEDFIGIVRGRTVNSSRGRTQAPAPASAPSKSKSKQPAKGGARQKPAARKPVGKSSRSPRGGSGAPKGAKRGKPRR